MSTDATQHPIVSTSVQIGADGSWAGALEGQDISAGMHQIRIEDGYGNSDEALLYVVKDEPQFLDRINHIVPPGYSYALLSLSAVIICLVVVELWLGQRADASKSVKNIRSRKYIVIAIIAALIALAVTFTVGKIVSENKVSTSIGKNSQTQVRPKIDVTGTVRTPFSHQAIEGVDLTAGDTSIKTILGGKFAFNSIYQDEGMRLNHPMLKTAFIKTLPQSGPMDLIFDATLYNSVFDIAQQESRGKLSDIYEALDEVVKVNTSKDVFLEKYQRLYLPNDTLDQAIVIADVIELKDWVSEDKKNSYPQVIQVTVENYPQLKDYLFVPTDSGWSLIK